MVIFHSYVSLPKGNYHQTKQFVEHYNIEVNMFLKLNNYLEIHPTWRFFSLQTHGAAQVPVNTLIMAGQMDQGGK